MMMYIGFAGIMTMGIITIDDKLMYMDILGIVRIEGGTLVGIILIYLISLIIYSLDKGDWLMWLMGNKYIQRVIKAEIWRRFLLEERGEILSIVKRIYRRGIADRKEYEKLIKLRKLLKHTERRVELKNLGIKLEEEEGIIKMGRLYGIYKKRKGTEKEINKWRLMKAISRLTKIGIWLKDIFGLVEYEVGVLSIRWIKHRRKYVKMRRSMVGGMVIMVISWYYKLYKEGGISGELAGMVFKMVGCLMIFNLTLNVMELCIGIVYSMLNTWEFWRYGKGRRGLYNKEGRRALIGIIIKNISSITAIIIIKGYISIS